MTQTSVLRSNPSNNAAPAAFRCTRSPGRQGAVWIHLTGELDLSHVPVVTDKLREAQVSSYMVAVDLRELEFIDRAGLGALVAADAQARLTNKSLVLIRGSGQVDRMLEQTGMLTQLEVVDLRVQRATSAMQRGTDTPRPEHLHVRTCGLNSKDRSRLALGPGGKAVGGVRC